MGKTLAHRCPPNLAGPSHLTKEMTIVTNFITALLNVLGTDLPHLFDNGITGVLPAVQNLLSGILAVFTGQ